MAENKSILELTKKLLTPDGIPISAAADAAHVATAVVHECDYLLTWNLRHMNNDVMRRHIEEVCAANGFRAPRILTPKQLAEEEP